MAADRLISVGAETAACASIFQSTTLRNTCAVDEMMVGPPAAPTTTRTWPLPIGPPAGMRWTQNTQGLGDISVGFQYWVLNTEKHPDENLQLSLGVHRNTCVLRPCGIPATSSVDTPPPSALINPISAPTTLLSACSSAILARSTSASAESLVPVSSRPAR